MSVSIVVTTADDAADAEECLEGVAALARPGDQIVAVDAGSRDGTDRILRAFMDRGGAGPGVEWHIVELGVRPPGGPGIASNVGADAATRDHVLFIRGGDRAEPLGRTRALVAARERAADVTLANYARAEGGAADAALWGAPPGAVPDRLRALRHDPVPGRTLLRRAFLVERGLRHPEGTAWDEAAFHWRVYAAAERIAFADAVLCRRAAAAAPAAPHAAALHDAVVADLPAEAQVLRAEALRQLLRGLLEEAERLTPAETLPFAADGAAALARVPDAVWNAVAAEGGAPVMPSLLRRGEVGAVVAALQGTALGREVAALREEVRDAARDAAAARRSAAAVAAAARFEALRALAPEEG